MMSNPSEAWIEFPGPDGTTRALAVTPATTAPWPTMIVIHGASGLDPYHATVTSEFAARGYLAVAPDIYTFDRTYQGFTLEVVEAGMELGRVLRTGNDEAFLAKFSVEQREAIKRAYAWLESRLEKTYIRTVKACFDHLQGRDDVRSIGVVGFCMGGRLAAELAASGAALNAGVIFYGIDPGPDAVSAIRCPMQGHYGVTDRRITDRVPNFAAAMKAAGKEFDYFVYDAGHGFANAPYLPMHNADAASLAFGRAHQFLARHVLSVAAHKIEAAIE
jgi:carboxymethylenebutenolidase